MRPTPEQFLLEVHADFARMVPDLRRMFARAAAAYPGPRAAVATSTSSSPDTVISDDDLGQLTADERRALLGADLAEREAAAAVRQLLALHKQLCRLDATLAPYRTRTIGLDPNDVPPGWCPNCYRCGQHHSATKMRKRDGELAPLWSDGLCSWCGNFRQVRGWLPTKQLVDRHHGIGNVTEDLIARVQRGLPRNVKDQIRAHEKAKAAEKQN